MVPHLLHCYPIGRVLLQTQIYEILTLFGEQVGLENVRLQLDIGFQFGFIYSLPGHLPVGQLVADHPHRPNITFLGVDVGSQ